MNNERRIKITVLKRAFNEEFAQLYGVEGLERCPEFEEKEEYFLEADPYTSCYQSLDKPEGFCEEAWQSIRKYVFALIYGSNENNKFQFDDWIKIPGVAICSCSDGIRPVTFKVELEENTEEKEMQEDHEEIIDGNEEDDQDELVVTVFQDTKTVQLLDEFEGYTGDNPHKYKRMVINNYAGEPKIYGYRYSYVVERNDGKEAIGNITFTDLKLGKSNKELIDYIQSQISENTAKKYVNTNKFFRFNKPYLFRAQNKRNRTGYGTIWEWSGGVGYCTEGTYYGETTLYVIAGVYLTSQVSGGYNLEYCPSFRKKFYSTKSNKMEIILTYYAMYYIFEINTYLNSMDDNVMKNTERMFLKISVTNDDSKCEERYLLVFVDEEEHVVYMSNDIYNTYKDNLYDGLYLWNREDVPDDFKCLVGEKSELENDNDTRLIKQIIKNAEYLYWEEIQKDDNREKYKAYYSGCEIIYECDIDEDYNEKYYLNKIRLSDRSGCKIQSKIEKSISNRTK